MPAFFPFPGARCWSRKTLARLALCLTAGYIVLVLVLLCVEDSLVYHPYSPSRRWDDPPAGCEAHDFYLPTPSGTRVHARWYPCPGADRAVLVCHSRAGNLSVAVAPGDLHRWHREVGASVLVFDYPGYGRSEGRPSETGCYAAAEAAYEWLTHAQDIDPGRILILGRSLGTAVAVDLASRRPHQALVLISPFTSLPDVGHALCPFLPTRTLMRNRFNSLAKIPRCEAPLLVFHGARDRLVPCALGKRLFAAAHCPKRFVRVSGAGHNNTVLADFFPQLQRFLADFAEPGGLEIAAGKLAGIAGWPTISMEGFVGPCGSDQAWCTEWAAGERTQEKVDHHERDHDPTGGPRAQCHGD
jgi:pimeloyl-ACP methyl ester carboxylesterase